MQQRPYRLRNCLLISIWAASSFLLSSGITAQRPANMESPPDVLRMPAAEEAGAPPAWASAQAVADPDRGLNWEALGAAEDSPLRAEVRRQAALPHADTSIGVAQIPEKACTSISIDSSFTAAEDPPADNVDDLVTNAQGVYAGTITAVTPGFSVHSPYSLLTLKIQETLREAAGTPSSIFILHPVAHFRVGPYVFCGAPSKSFGDPKVGDQVLIFVYRWVKNGTWMVAPVQNEFLLATGKGLVLPPALKADPRLQVATFSELVQAVRRLMASPLAHPGTTSGGSRP
ncbi:MAG TPA: hypothetical protein VKY89_13920 [Thermoanaerobaculia bacterium]|nr:hypothetical protein [Thermoanaerobaculia bacterium]